YSMAVFRDSNSIESEITIADGDTYTTTVAGQYSFIITDSEGCSDTTNIVEVTSAAPPTVTPNLVHPLCAGSANGTIELDITGGLPPYTINLNGLDNSKIGGLAAGTYNYTVTDFKGCETPGSVTLIDPDKLI